MRGVQSSRCHPLAEWTRRHSFGDAPWAISAAHLAASSRAAASTKSIFRGSTDSSSRSCSRVDASDPSGARGTFSAWSSARRPRSSWASRSAPSRSRRVTRACDLRWAAYIRGVSPLRDRRFTSAGRHRFASRRRRFLAAASDIAASFCVVGAFCVVVVVGAFRVVVGGAAEAKEAFGRDNAAEVPASTTADVDPRRPRDPENHDRRASGSLRSLEDPPPKAAAAAAGSSLGLVREPASSASSSSSSSKKKTVFGGGAARRRASSTSSL
mmetsp:Transcript_1306/g.4440  ORF Transcript_1306/g.4440 Transcript_1306/m.4440 type:complete len:269 (-) Transcript_1306:382-1188(-)